MLRAGDTRERLLECACELIHAHGYQGVGVQELCDAAGVKKGSFYHFFPSKQDLALEVIERQWQKMQREMLEPAFAPDVPPLARIERYFAMAARALDETRSALGVVCGCPFGNLSLELGACDDRVRRKLDQVFRSWAGWFEAALREAVEAGDLPETQNSVAVAGRLAGSVRALLTAQAA
jgi:TetR/AcrR family transcriptional repressor of nem operon